MDPADADLLPTIKRRIVELIEEHQTNMKAVSLGAGMGATYVRDILERNRAPSAPALAKIARFFGTTSDDITGQGEAAIFRANEQTGSSTSPAFISDLVTVPEYDVRLSAGGGTLIERENQTGVWQWPRSYLVNELRLNPATLGIVEVEGDSMEPTLRPGDRVMVDHGDRNVARPGVYALWDSNATVVKRVEKVPASDPAEVVLISDNKNHNEYRVFAELVNVIGRVVWFARRM